MPHDVSIREQAVAWAVRTDDPGFDDWDAFTAWLEEDPAHAVAYDEIGFAVAEAAAGIDEGELPAPANDEEPAIPLVRRRWFGGAIAACLGVMVLLGVWRSGGEQSFETAPGEVRTIALDDGGTIELAGGSRLVLDGEDARFARLEDGQALFTIVHDENNPFRVEVRGDTLVDIGTVFDVRTGGGALAVSVSEGAVLYNPDQQKVHLAPGDQLTSPAGGEFQVSRVPLEMVGEWREGRLTFQQATLAQVATDLRRATGLDYRAAPGSAGRQVSGSIVVTGLKDDPRALGPLLGVTVQPADNGWVIEAP